MSSFYLDDSDQRQSVGALALGSFDGVHLGHQALLQKAVEISRVRGLEAGALCFSPNPKSFFASKDKAFLKIYSLEQNISALLDTGLQKVFVKRFDLQCSQMSASEFLDHLFSKIQFTDIVVGFDFKLGKDRSGGMEKLRVWCDQHSIELHTVEAQNDSEGKLSSTRIKSSLLKGDVEAASKLLGRAHSYIGYVCSDQGIGKKIGFPTLNLKPSLKSGGFKYTCLSNIGVRPTVFETSAHLVLETHILSSDKVSVKPNDLIEVELKQFLRPEQKFDSLEELKRQIAEDVVRAKSLANLYKT